MHRTSSEAWNSGNNRLHHFGSAEENSAKVFDKGLHIYSACMVDVAMSVCFTIIQAIAPLARITT